MIHGEPIPVDIYMDLTEAGYSPEKLTTAFLNGLCPPIKDHEMIVFEETQEEQDEEVPGLRMIQDEAVLEDINEELELKWSEE